MGSLYTGEGDQTDFELELESTGLFIERTGDQTVKGTWSESAGNLYLRPEDPNVPSMDYRILRIETLEWAENFMVLRWAGIASRNLPILFYRVHRSD
jgi:hypothetical protein